jgi:S1-C subfamily serine protease
VTTHADVIRALGPPESEVVSSSGSRSMIYIFSHFSTKAASFIPVVGIFAGGAKAQTSAVTIRFDPNGKLAEVTASNTAIDSTGFGNVTMQATPTTVPVQAASAATPSAVLADSNARPTVTPARVPSGVCPFLGADLAKLAVTSMGIDGVTGAMISGVSPTGAAASAGIRKGDIVIRVGDSPINDPADVEDAICQIPVGTAIDVKLSRQAQPMWVSVRF